VNTADNFEVLVTETKVRSAIQHLTLVNFRNYRYLRLNLEKPFLVFYGENGSGKTNILEAVSFLSPGRGLRNCKLSEVKTFDLSKDKQPPFLTNSSWGVSAQIKNSEEEFEIGTSVESTLREIDFNEAKSVEKRIIKVNTQKISSQAELNNYISLIWVTPQMDRLFSGSPQNRRNFLDRIVCSFDTEHTKRLSSFDNLYHQWLQILKNGSQNHNWLLSLEDQLAALGVSIAAARKEQINKLNLFIEQNPDDIFPEAMLELDGTVEQLLNEKPAVYVEDFYRESLFKQRRSVLFNDSGNNFNKTDLCVFYKKKNIPAALCSTGEQKSLLLSIILSQAKSLSFLRGNPPILLLDEIAAHLDEKKKDAFLSKIHTLETQVWLTTTDKNEFINIKSEAQFFNVKNNMVKEN
jgi:DNA replication and repair protein RecF